MLQGLGPLKAIFGYYAGDLADIHHPRVLWRIDQLFAHHHPGKGSLVLGVPSLVPILRPLEWACDSGYGKAVGHGLVPMRGCPKPCQYLGL